MTTILSGNFLQKTNIFRALCLLGTAALAVPAAFAGEQKTTHTPRNGGEVIARAGALSVTADEMLSERAISGLFTGVAANTLSTTEGQELARLALKAKAAEAALPAGRQEELKTLLSVYRQYALADMARRKLMRETESQSTATLWRSAWDLAQTKPQGSSSLAYRFIFLRTLGLSPEQAAEKKKKADGALERLRKGEDFVKLAQELSDAEIKDDRTLPLNDKTPNFDPKLRARLEKTPAGQFTDVIKGRAGYAIFQIVRKNPALPAGTAFEKGMADPDVRRVFMQHLPGLSEELALQKTEQDFGKVKLPAAAEVQPKLKNDAAEIFRYHSLPLTAGQLKALLTVKGQTPSNGSIDKALAELGRQYLLANYAIQKQMSLGSEEQAQWEGFKRGMVQQLLRQDIEKKTGQPAESDLKAWLVKNQDFLPTNTLLLACKRLTLTAKPGSSALPLQTRDEAERLWQALKNGGDAGKLARDYKSADFMLSVDEIEEYPSQQYQSLGLELPASVLNGEKLPKPFQSGNNFILLSVTSSRRGRPSLAQAHDAVAQAWRRAAMTKAMEDLTGSALKEIRFTGALKNWTVAPDKKMGSNSKRREAR